MPPTEIKPASLPSGFSLTAASPQDLPGLERLMAAYLSELGLAADPRGLDAVLADLADLTASYADGDFLILKQGRAVVGCVGLRLLEGQTAELKRFYLQPTLRGRGLGRSLLGAAVELAQRNGFAKIVLDTRGELEAANRLYRQKGFVEIEDYNHNPRAHYFLALQLEEER